MKPTGTRTAPWVVVLALCALSLPMLSGGPAGNGTPYGSSLFAATPRPEALPRSCKETRCSQQADGTYVCIKINSAPWACKVGQAKTSCTETGC